MRILLNVDLDTAAGNEAIESGRMGQQIQDVLEKLKPEAAYFHPRNGRRGMTLVVNWPDSASLVSLVEPLWLQLGANVETVPCMNADELAEGLARRG